MLENIETQTTNAKHAVEDMAGKASDSAVELGGRFAKMARLAMRAMPLLPEQAIDFALARAGLVRKRSGLGAAALFAGGFVAGSVVTALTTPMTGADLRTRIKTSVRSGVVAVVDPVAESAGLESAPADQPMTTKESDSAKDNHGSKTRQAGHNHVS